MYSISIRSFVALGALLGIVSCSGSGVSGVAGGAATTTALPAVAARAPVAPAAAIVTADSSLLSDANAARAAAVGIDATELASLAVPSTSDVAPVGDALEPFVYGWTLTGTYHGLINNFVPYGPNGTAAEEKGGMTVDVQRSGSSFTGSGQARDGQFVVSVTFDGTVAAEYLHSVVVQATLTSYASNGTIGCAYSGEARRYPHVFLGVLRAPAACDGGLVFFKVHPEALH